MDIKIEPVDDEYNEKGEAINKVWFDVPIENSDNPKDFKDVSQHIKSEDHTIQLYMKEEIPDICCAIKCEVSENIGECENSSKEYEEKFSTNSYASVKRETIPNKETAQKKSFICSACFHVNLATHSPDEVPNCSQCGYRSTTSTAKVDKNPNACVKVFKCDRCYFRSSNRANYERHKMSHGGETDFKCSQCDFRSSYMGFMLQHEISHTSHKRFQCDLCEYKSTYVCHLETHKMTHSGDLPFKCDQCGYKAIYSYHLEKHKASYHTGKPKKVVKVKALPKSVKERVRDWRAKKRAQRAKKKAAKEKALRETSVDT